METYINYKGYGISYYSCVGTTVVESLGMKPKIFPSLGEQKGLELAKKHIDGLLDYVQYLETCIDNY